MRDIYVQLIGNLDIYFKDSCLISFNYPDLNFIITWDFIKCVF